MKTFSKKNKVTLLRNGKDFIEMNVAYINSAEHFIFLHTYILKVDEVTGPVILALTEAARRGVQVFVLVDGFGSFGLTEEFIAGLVQADVHFAYFKPLTHFNHIGRRLHQKVLIVDNQRCIIGGINLSKSFNLPDEMHPWLDYACTLEGDEIQRVFSRIKKLYTDNFPLYRKEILSYQKIQPKPAIETCLIRTTVNDWMRYKSDIFKSYLQAIRSANTAIYLLAPYFIPSRKLLQELKKAQRRGVEIHLFLGKQSDHPIIQKVEHYFFKWYMLNNFKIYEWPKSVVHGKLALVDKSWVTIGSYNHNYISRFGNIELNLEIKNKSFAQTVSDEFDRIIEQSEMLDKHSFESRYTLVNRLYYYSSFIILSSISFISIFFVFRRGPKKKLRKIKEQEL